MKASLPECKCSVIMNNGGNSAAIRGRLLAMRAFAAMLVLAGVAAFGQEHRALTLQEAHELVLAAIPGPTKRLPKFDLDDFTMPGQERFFFVEALWDNPKGSVVYGGYAVDRVTGDILSAATCREEQSRRLRTAQRRTRKRIGLSDVAYQKARHPGPMCE